MFFFLLLSASSGSAGESKDYFREDDGRGRRTESVARQGGGTVHAQGGVARDVERSRGYGGEDQRRQAARPHLARLNNK